MTSFRPTEIDLSLVEVKVLAHLVLGITNYVKERSRVSAIHKLATADEIAETEFLDLLVVGTRTTKLRIVEAVLAQLVKDGKLFQYDCYYSTENKEIW